MWPEALKLLLLWLPSHDGLYPWTVSQNQPFLPEVVSARLFHHRNRRKWHPFLDLSTFWRFLKIIQAKPWAQELVHRMCSVSTNVPEKTDWKCGCCMLPHIMVPPSLLIQRQQQEENPRAPRQSDEWEVSSQSTGHIPNFPPSQKQNEIQIALPKPWDALPNSGNHHHQIRPKSQNNSNMPGGGRSLSPFYKDLSPNIHLCPQTDFQNVTYSYPQL